MTTAIRAGSRNAPTTRKTILSHRSAAGSGACGGDCSDGDPAIYPGAAEVCDGLDGDCNGVIPADEVDGDGDGYEVCAGDCDDGDPAVSPAATEQCNGVDDDCDGAVPADEGDLDGDGHLPCGGDCDDGDPAVYAGAPDVCDGVADNDCDGATDPWEADVDADGYTPCEGDCDDAEPSIFPGAVGVTLVPDDVSTVQGAMDAAVAGGVICLGPGTHAGGLDYGGRAVRVIGTLGSGSTVIGEAELYSVEFSASEGGGASLEGATVQGRKGIWIEEASVLLRDVVVRDLWDNSSVAVWAENATLELREVQLLGAVWGLSISASTVDATDLVVRDCGDVYWDQGMAIHADEGSDVTIAGGEATGNYVQRYGGGIGMESSILTLSDFALVDNEADYGGGLALYGDSTATVANVWIEDNDASFFGGGIHVSDTANLTATGIRVAGNSLSYSHGGGIYIADESEVVLEQIVVAGNRSTSGYGAGLYVGGDARLSLSHSVVAANRVEIRGGGGALVSTAGATVRNTLFVANTAVGNEGGGLYLASGDHHLENVAVVGNSAGGYGGGIYVDDSGAPTLDGVILAGNTGAWGGGICCDACAVSVTYSDLWANLPQDVVGMADPVGVDGNLGLDPEFLDTLAADPLDWDLHLAVTSPLVDAGNPALADPDGTDADMGPLGGPDAGGWDLDQDGFPAWWQPGPYDFAVYPGLGWDCDDDDPDVGPGDGC